MDAGHRQAVTRRPALRHGEAFQAAVVRTCEIYTARGLACLHEVPVPYRQVGTVKFGHHQGRAVIQRLTSTVDVSGHLAGIPTAIECKSFAEDRLTISSGRRTMVHKHQLAHLLAFARSARRFDRQAAAFLLCEFRASGEIWAVSPEWLLKNLNERKSIPLGEIRAAGHPHAAQAQRGARGVPVDFQGCVLGLAKRGCGHG